MSVFSDDDSVSALDAEIIDRYQKYLGRTPSADEIAQHRGNPNGIAGVGASIANSDEYRQREAQYGLNDGGTATNGPTGPTGGGGSGGGPSPTQTGDERQASIRGHVLAEFKKIMGREPSESELATEVQNYARYGGDQMRANFTARAANNRGPDTPGPSGQPGPSSGSGSGSSGSGPMLSDMRGGYQSWGQAIPLPERTAAPAPMQAFGETFTAPDPQKSRESPGFQFRFDQAMEAIERSGLAKGNYFTNAVSQGLQEQGANIADTYYDQDYGRALSDYTTRRDTHNQNEGNRFDSERANRGDSWGQETDTYGMTRTNRMDDRGIFEDDRNFGRSVYTDDRNFGRSVYQDDRNFNRGVYVDDRNYGRGVLESDRNYGMQRDEFGRLVTNDTWGRGADLWDRNRQTDRDRFNDTITLENLRLRSRARPT